MRTLWWQDQGFPTLVTHVLVKCHCEFRVPVVNQIPFVQEKAVKGIGKLPGTLHHKRLGGMERDPRKMDASCAQFHHHQDVVGNQAMPGSHFHGEKVRGGKHFPMYLEKL